MPVSALKAVASSSTDDSSSSSPAAIASVMGGEQAVARIATASSDQTRREPFALAMRRRTQAAPGEFRLALVVPAWEHT